MNYVHTLAYNLVSETEKSVKLLYEQNENFVHVIVDLGFPLTEDKIPENIQRAKLINSELLRDMANRYGSRYFKTENIGVSQNWTAVYKHLKLSDYDTLICCDPDERPKNNGWVKAVGDVLKYNSRYAWVSLMMPEHVEELSNVRIDERFPSGHRVFEIEGGLNWAQGGFSGRFLNRCGGVPFIKSHPVYGHIETASIAKMKETEQTWCFLPDYIVEHTDYELGHEGTSKILRDWKNYIVFSGKKQITLDQYICQKY